MLALVHVVGNGGVIEDIAFRWACFLIFIGRGGAESSLDAYTVGSDNIL